MNKKIKSEKNSSSDDLDYQSPAVCLNYGFAYKLVEILFDIKPILLSNLSLLSDFEILGEIPGHEYTNLIDIPKEDIEKFYPHFKDEPQDQLKEIRVRNPPISDEKWAILDEQMRMKHLKLVESKFNISMKNYPEEELYVWKVAHYIMYKQKKHNASMYCC